jgi:lipopolysaccharide/colanic/teichoic acid biosynthesis glycosyltransferase
MLGSSSPGLTRRSSHETRARRVRSVSAPHASSDFNRSRRSSQRNSQPRSVGAFGSDCSPVRAVASELGTVHASLRGIGFAFKRGLDLLGAGLALLALSPVFFVIGILIKLTSPGPVFFRQERVGRDQRIFGMFKFRSMVANAEELRPKVAELNDARGISFKIFDDPRVTAIGRVLRRTSLDELPQLLNVMAGDMSLVGPRPIPVWVADQLDKDRYRRRFCVQPGLTGLWQVEGRQQDFDWMAIQDLRYIDEWSLLLDLKIVLSTIPAVVRGEGAH